MKLDHKNNLACMVCGKPEEVSLDECHSSFGKSNPLCSNAGTCRVVEKTDEQLKYVLSSSGLNVFLKACPGSGKTESVGLKAAYEIKTWDAKIGGIAVLTQLVAERFPFLIIDECQDLSWIQLQIFMKLIEAGSRVHFVGDLNQGIYAFKKVYPQKVAEFAMCHNFETLELSKNLRSVQPIVDLCGKIVNQGNVQGVSTGTIDPSCVYFAYDAGKLQEVVGWFVSYLEEHGIKSKDAAIVARGYSTVNKLRPAASRIPQNKQLCLATAIHLWQNGGTESRGEALNCIGRFMAENFFTAETTNARAYYCPNCEPSHLRWRVFLAQILDKCVETESLQGLNQIWSKWAKIVSEQFEEIVKSCSKIEMPSQNNRSFSLRAIKGSASQTVISTLETVEKSDVSNILVTTFHQVKGRTFDAILVVSAPDKRSDGGHWSQWVDAANSDGEHARFAYVASSRPKVLLGWAIPSPSEEDEKKLKELGLTAINETGVKQ